jgi:hypothetical protein
MLAVLLGSFACLNKNVVMQDVQGFLVRLFGQKVEQKVTRKLL